MGSPTGNDTSHALPLSGVAESPFPPAPGILAHQLQEGLSLDASPFTNENLSTLLAIATNDAIRDLDLKSSRLSWPQGLNALLGYTPTATTSTTSFWNERVHPEDLPRVSDSLRRGDCR